MQYGMLSRRTDISKDRCMPFESSDHHAGSIEDHKLDAHEIIFDRQPYMQAT